MNHPIILIDGRCIDDTSTGVANYTIELIKSYQKQYGYDNVLVIRRIVDHSANYKIIVYPHKAFSFINFFRFHNFINNISPKIFHAPFHYNSFFKAKNCYYITTIHDLIYLKIPKFLRNNRLLNFIGKIKTNYFIRRSLKNSDLIVTISKTTKNDIKTHFNKESVVIPNGTNVTNEIKPSITRFKCFNLLPQSYFLYVGLTAIHKNIEFLIECFNYAVTDKKLIICGKNTRHISSDNPNITFLGFVSIEELEFLYHNTAAFIYPSLYEGFGLPILEALSRRVKVFSSTGGSLKEFSPELINFFDPKDHKGLIQLLENVENIPLPSQKAVDEYLKGYNWENNFNKLQKIISDKLW